MLRNYSEIKNDMLIEEHYESIDACRFCFMCRHMCTVGVASGRESDTPRGKALILFGALKGHMEYSDDLVETIYRCCLCGVCNTFCAGGYTLHKAIEAARGDIVALGKEPAAAREIKDNIAATGNPFGRPAEERFNALEQTNLVKDNAEVLYYVGCDAAYNNPEIANAMIKVLSHCGVNFTLLGEETTSGKPLTVLGYREEAKSVSKSLAEKIRVTGCKTLVTTCPSSYDAFKNDYPNIGAELDGIEILHAAEYLDRLMDEGKLALTKPLNQTVAIQDSDYLCRFNGIHKQPRRLLKAIPGLKLTEMTWTGDKAYSCGEAGGIHHLINPALSKTLSARILAEAETTAAALLATTCPITKKSLQDTNSSDLKIKDIVEIIEDTL